MFDQPHIVSFLAYLGKPSSLTVEHANRAESTYRADNGTNSVEFFDVSLNNAVTRLTKMLQHYPDSVSINGNFIPTSPFPDISFVNVKTHLGFIVSNHQLPTEPASSPRCFNAYAAGVLCQIPNLQLQPRIYLDKNPSNYRHWNHVTRYVITPVAHLNLDDYSRCVYENAFLDIADQRHSYTASCRMPPTRKSHAPSRYANFRIPLNAPRRYAPSRTQSMSSKAPKRK